LCHDDVYYSSQLFYLTMDINIKRTGIPLRRSLALDDDSKPVELKSCHPWGEERIIGRANRFEWLYHECAGECKFTLQMRKGGVVRVYDSVLMAESRYKCLLVSEQTTAADVTLMLFRLYGVEAAERAEDYVICEKSTVEDCEAETERPLAMDEKLMQVREEPVRILYLTSHLPS